MLSFLSKFYQIKLSYFKDKYSPPCVNCREANGVKQFIPLQQQDIGDACIKSPFCDKNAKYRTIDGFCNNLEFPEWGVSGVPLVRIVPGSYSDGKAFSNFFFPFLALEIEIIFHT